MATALFIWVGSGRARRRKIDSQGIWLDQAAHAGLPVPPSAILLAELMQVCLSKGLAERNDGHIAIPDPELLHNTLFHSVRLPRFWRPVTITPLFAIENEADKPRLSWQRVNLNDAHDMAAALAAIWSAALPYPTARADILILEDMDATCAGRARTCQSEANDEIEINRPSTSTRSLPRLRSWRTLEADRPPYERRLQLLLSGVRRTFGRGDWAIKWADDGRICWLLEVLSPARA
jgi:pyruvate,water dikinase